MNFMRRTIAALLFLVTGCVRNPETIDSPRITLRASIENNRVYYTMVFSGGIRNENSDTVLLDYKGEIRLGNGSEGAAASPATVIPFTVKEIFPFQTAVLSLEVKGAREDFRPVFDLAEIDENEVLKSGVTEEIPLREENLELKTISYRASSIHGVLEGEGNEKIR